MAAPCSQAYSRVLCYQLRPRRCALSYILVPADLRVLESPRQILYAPRVIDLPTIETDETQAQCATYYHHMIFATSFNISSDLMLILIPLPIIIKTHLPVKRQDPSPTQFRLSWV